MRNFFQIAGPVAGSVAGSVVGIVSLIAFVAYSVVTIGNHVTAPNDIAVVTDTRIRVESGEQNDTLTQLVIRCNQQITSFHEYNKCWWADIAIPDSWDEVERIEWPEESHD